MELYHSHLFLNGSEGAACLITLMWEASESLLSLSDCSPLEPFAYTPPPPPHCPASHRLNYPLNILPHAFSDEALCWEWLSGCAFQPRMKIQAGGGENEKNTGEAVCEALFVVFVLN